MNVLYEDRDVIVCHKPAGVLSAPAPTGGKSLMEQIAAYRRARGESDYVGLIHRLDTGTAGVILYAKNRGVTPRLCATVADHTVCEKRYLAVVQGRPEGTEGTFVDLLFKDARANKSYVVQRPRRGVKEASLTWRALETVEDPQAGTLTLIEVTLHTGRTHQIRVQFASRGLPLVGDGKYGSREKAPYIGLWAFKLTFPHPMTGKELTAAALPDTETLPWSLFHGEIPNE